MKKIINKKYLIYAFLVSFLTLLFTSKNSLLYTFNDWVDANAFFTVGKSMMNGVVPYKDLFEQKGLILYIIYGIGYLFSNRTFHGVFILEVINFSIFLYYAHKIFNFYLKEKYSYILLPILAFLITTSYSFVHGGSCEEFSLTFLIIGLYYFIKHFKINKLTNKEVILTGICAGIIMQMKYTMLGFYIGFGFFIFLDYLLKKEIKDAFKFCMYFLIGMFIPFILCLVYLGINHAIKDYIKCYYIFNMTLYKDSTSILGKMKLIPLTVYKSIIKDSAVHIISLIITIPLIFKIKNKDKNIYFHISLICLILFTLLGIYWGLRSYDYYLLPVYIFIVLPLIGISLIISKYLNKIIDKKYMYGVFILINVLFIFLSYNNANYKYMLNYTKDDYFQYKYADYINKYENPTLLNMGFLDAGLYTTSGIVPNTRFFEVQNISYEVYPDNVDEMSKYVKNKKIMFVLYYTEKDISFIKEKHNYILNNYDLVLDDTYMFENRKYNAYLFQVKE